MSSAALFHHHFRLGSKTKTNVNARSARSNQATNATTESKIVTKATEASNGQVAARQGQRVKITNKTWMTRQRPTSYGGFERQSWLSATTEDIW